MPRTISLRIAPLPQLRPLIARTGQHLGFAHPRARFVTARPECGGHERRDQRSAVLLVPGEYEAAGRCVGHRDADQAGQGRFDQ